MRGHQNPSFHRFMARYGIPDFPLKAEILAKQVEVIPLAPTPQIASRLLDCMKLRMLPTEKRRGKKGCGLAICAICNLARSSRLIDKGAHFTYDHRLRGVHYTRTNSADSAKVTKIESLRLDLMKNDIIEALTKARDALGPKFIAIAGLEISLDETLPPPGVRWTAKAKKLAHRWSPHWHIIIICENPMLAVPYLTPPLVGPTSMGEKRLVPRPSLTVGRHIAYATKFEAERRAIVLDSNGYVDRKPRTLGKKRTKQLFQFLGEMPVSKRVLVLGNWKKPLTNSPSPLRKG